MLLLLLPFELVLFILLYFFVLPVVVPVELEIVPEVGVVGALPLLVIGHPAGLLMMYGESGQLLPLELPRITLPLPLIVVVAVLKLFRFSSSGLPQPFNFVGEWGVLLLLLLLSMVSRLG